MSNSWTNRAVAAGLLVLAAAPAAAQKFECPEGMGYDFAYTNPDFGAAQTDGWNASVKRASGSSATGVPTLSVRKDIMRCRYQLPNGAFMLVTRPFPGGVDCIIDQDDYFDLPYFRCE